MGIGLEGFDLGIAYGVHAWFGQERSSMDCTVYDVLRILARLGPIHQLGQLGILIE